MKSSVFYYEMLISSQTIEGLISIINQVKKSNGQLMIISLKENSLKNKQSVKTYDLTVISFNSITAYDAILDLIDVIFNIKSFRTRSLPGNESSIIQGFNYLSSHYCKLVRGITDSEENKDHD